MGSKTKLFFQLVRFGIVGVSASAVHFCVVVSLVELAALKPLVANIFAFFISFQVSYFGHSNWTFGETATLHRVALPRLLLVSVIAMAINETMFYFMMTFFQLPYPIALLVVLTTIPIVTFIINKLWVFR